MLTVQLVLDWKSFAAILCGVGICILADKTSPSDAKEVLGKCADSSTRIIGRTNRD